MQRDATRHRWVRLGMVGLTAVMGVGLGIPATPATAAPTVADPGPAGTQTNPPMGLDRLDQRDFDLSGTFSWRTTGRNVHAYVLGDRLATTHTTFGGRATNGPDFSNGRACVFETEGTGLASAVGGTTHGVAKEVRIVGVRIVSCTGQGEPQRVVQALDWVTANAVKPAVAVLNVTVGADPAVDAAALRLIRSGVVLVTTSGEPEEGSPGGRDVAGVSPGRLTEPITVGRTWADLIETAVTRRGPSVDLFAPFSTAAFGPGSDEYDISNNAAGLVGGAVALILSEHPTWTPAQVQEALVAHATPNEIFNPAALGGSPNLLLYVGP